MKKGPVNAAIICLRLKSYVMSPNPAFLQSQRDESLCHRATRRGNHAAPNEGKLIRLPSGPAMKRPASPMGRLAGWLPRCKRLGSGGCGLAAPSIDEDEPAMVRRALLIILHSIARHGKEG